MPNLVLHPADIPDWEAEDIVSNFLGTPAVMANAEDAKAMLDAITLNLPETIVSNLLPNPAPLATQIGVSLSGGVATHDFYIFQITPSILIPDGNRLHRLRLSLQLSSDIGMPETWDLFPPDQWDIKQVNLGEAKLDVSKALKLVCPAIPDCLGLTLDVPIRWNTQTVNIRCSDRTSNPVEWYVTDNSVQHGFTGTVIVRVPKGGNVRVAASMAGELRKSNLLGRILKARFVTDRQQYKLNA